MNYALWDIRADNMVGGFDNERDALELVWSGIELNGPEDTDTLYLNAEDENGIIHLVAQGQELAERARREFSGQRLIG